MSANLFRCPSCGREWRTVAEKVGSHYTPETARTFRIRRPLLCRGEPKLVKP